MKEKANFADGNIEAFAQVGTHSERVAFKKSEDTLQHIRSVSKFYFRCRSAGIF